MGYRSWVERDREQQKTPDKLITCNIILNFHDVVFQLISFQSVEVMYTYSCSTLTLRTHLWGMESTSVFQPVLAFRGRTATFSVCCQINS